MGRNIHIGDRKLKMVVFKLSLSCPKVSGAYIRPTRWCKYQLNCREAVFRLKDTCTKHSLNVVSLYLVVEIALQLRINWIEVLVFSRKRYERKCVGVKMYFPGWEIWNKIQEERIAKEMCDAKVDLCRNQRRHQLQYQLLPPCNIKIRSVISCL